MIEGVDPHPLGATDAGMGREDRQVARENICLERLREGQWCKRVTGHDGPHLPGAAPRELPVNTFDKGMAKR